MKKLVLTILIALTVSTPAYASSVPFSQLNDCSGNQCMVTDRANELHAATVAPLNRQDMLFSGKLTRVKGNIYKLTNGAKTIKISVKLNR